MTRRWVDQKEELFDQKENELINQKEEIDEFIITMAQNIFPKRGE
jgi:hypothetical protein